MQPDQNAWRQVRRIAAKEITLFFSSPIAYLFLATFAVVTLFIFFWGESFFARNIADVRPMFEWMPLLLVFLASTLTMRLWSEERRTGTLEYVLTQPVPLWRFVVGKFLGCLGLLVLALVVTLPLPITVSIIADLDWGPVWAGYLAALLLGAAYLSIGLFVSARSENQIVSLICAAALCGFFYLLGSDTLTSFVGIQAADFLRLLGTGSRFESITRGVIDFRDLFYYLSIIAAFLALNTYVLEKERWSRTGQREHHRQWQTITALLIANALGANLWLGQITALRVDATEGNLYSLSDASKNYLGRLQEPLLIRGYFSSKTHPLLAPLVPQLEDMIEEYQIAGKGRVRTEFIDPLKDPEAEQEARQKYGIEAVPLQVADRYQSSIVSAYFNVLVQYGDEYEVMGFNDLIEFKGDNSGTDIEVQLRNPEHDITQAIKKVLNSYQAGGNLFDTVNRSLTFNAYVSGDDKIPEALADYEQQVKDAVDAVATEADGRLTVNFTDPEAGNGAVAQQIADDYGFLPMRTSLLSPDTFYFYMTLTDGDQMVQIPLDDMTVEGFKRNLDAGIKRFASGFTKTVAVVTPKPNPGANPYAAAHAQFNQLRSFLGAELNLVDEDLSDGSVNGQADLLLLLAPENLDEKSLFAVDQFLMQGGTVVAATSPYKSSFMGNSLSVQKTTSGLEDWLAHNGLSIEDSLVMDSQNAAFPVPVTRNLGGFRVQDWRMLDYPYFVDIRGDQLNPDSPVTADLPQLTLAWASPIDIDADKNAGRQVTPLLTSSDDSWLSTDTDVMPKVDANGNSGFTPGETQGAHVLGVVASGRFDSWFAGKDSPLLEEKAAEPETVTPDEEAAVDADAPAAAAEEEDLVASSVIERSPESARIILIASNDFLNDQIIQLQGTAGGTDYQNALQFVANDIDWSLEDSGLLSIRSRGHFNRTLPPMEQGSQMFWEYLNYTMAGVALGGIALVQRRRKWVKETRYSRLLAQSLEPTGSDANDKQHPEKAEQGDRT